MSKSNPFHLWRFGRTGALIFTQKSSKRGFALFSKRPQCHIFSSTVSETYGIDVSNDVWIANDIFFLTWTLFSTTVYMLFASFPSEVLRRTMFINRVYTCSGEKAIFVLKRNLYLFWREIYISRQLNLFLRTMFVVVGLSVVTTTLRTKTRTM